MSELLKLPADARAELAMALWESLSDAEREVEMALTLEQLAELDRRWAEHLGESGVCDSVGRSSTAVAG